MKSSGPGFLSLEGLHMFDQARRSTTLVDETTPQRALCPEIVK